MDSFEKPNILAGIQTSADAIKSGQKEYGSTEERQEAQQPDEHKAVMRLFGALAQALNAGYKFGERGGVGVAAGRRGRTPARMGGRGQRGAPGAEDARPAQHVLPCSQGEAACPIPSPAEAAGGRRMTRTATHKKSRDPEYIFFYNSRDTLFSIRMESGPRPVCSPASPRTFVLILLSRWWSGYEHGFRPRALSRNGEILRGSAGAGS